MQKLIQILLQNLMNSFQTADRRVLGKTAAVTIWPRPPCLGFCISQKRCFYRYQKSLFFFWPKKSGSRIACLKKNTFFYQKKRGLYSNFALFKNILESYFWFFMSYCSILGACFVFLGQHIGCCRCRAIFLVFL